MRSDFARRAMESAGAAEIARAIPSAPWKTLRVSHSSHSPDGDDVRLFQLSTDPGQAQYYNVNRWYEPSIARFASRDPDPFFGSSKQHLFAYAAGNPLHWVDPLGLRIGEVDQNLEGVLRCAVKNGPPEYQEALRWFINQDQTWDIKELGNSDSKAAKKRRQFFPPCWGDIVDSASRAILIDTRDSRCECVIEGMVREITELYANKKLGLSPDYFNGFGGASRYADDVVAHAKSKACTSCDCNKPYGRRGP